MKKLSNKTKLEILVGRLVILIIQSLIGCGLVLGFFYVLGLVQQVIECHFWLIIPLGIYVLYLIFKEI